MPAKASTRPPPSAAMKLASGCKCAKTGMLRARAAASTSAAPGDVPTTTSAWARASCASSGARNGPAGMTRPLPMPRRASTTSTAKSLASDGFWKPSSMTMTLAPAATAAARPPTRSRATMVGATRASRSGSSPTSARAMPRRIDPQRPGQRAAIAAAQEGRPFSRRLQHARDRERRRRLAGAAHGRIADADDRHAGARPRSLSCATAIAPYTAANGASMRAAAPASRHQNAGSRMASDSRRSSRICIR